MPRKSNAFKGLGRKLGTGEKVTPRQQKKDSESEYEDSGDDEENTSEEEELAEADEIDAAIAGEEACDIASSSKVKVNSSAFVDNDEDLVETEVESDGNLSHEDAEYEGDDCIEVIDLNNNCVRLPKGLDDDDDDAEESIEKNIQDDKRFEQQNRRRQYTMGIVIKRATENDKAQGKIIDFSDEAAEKLRLGDTKIKMEECTNGNFIATRNDKGKLQYRQFTQDQLNEMGLASSKNPCSCSVCTRRRKYAGDNWTVYGRTESRSGKKRGWYRYGEGQVLGEDEDKMAKRKK